MTEKIKDILKGVEAVQSSGHAAHVAGLKKGIAAVNLANEWKKRKLDIKSDSLEK